MNSQPRYEHKVTSPPLKLGAALLVGVILVAGISPLIHSIFS